MAKRKQAVVTFDDKAMILDPDKWPLWPYLPVKRKNNGLEDKNLGILICTKEHLAGKMTIYHVYFYNMSENLKNAPKTEYESVDEMLADDWIVD